MCVLACIKKMKEIGLLNVIFISFLNYFFHFYFIYLSIDLRPYMEIGLTLLK